MQVEIQTFPTPFPQGSEMHRSVLSSSIETSTTSNGLKAESSLPESIQSPQFFCVTCQHFSEQEHAGCGLKGKGASEGEGENVRAGEVECGESQMITVGEGNTIALEVFKTPLPTVRQKTMACKMCDAQTSPKNFIQHVMTADADPWFKCGICEQKFQSFQLASRHMTDFHPGHNPKDRIWENQLLSIDERAAKIHEGMDQCFGVDMDAQFSDGSKPESAQCRLCEKRIRVDLLGAHVLKGHLRAKRLYECVKCGRTSQFCFEMLAQHAGFSHGNPGSEMHRSVLSSSIETSTTSNGLKAESGLPESIQSPQFFCVTCQHFSEQEHAGCGLKGKGASEGEGENVRAGEVECGESQITVGEGNTIALEVFKTPLPTVRQKTMACKMCDAQTSPKNFIQHVMTAHADPWFKCGICEQKFQSFQLASRHMTDFHPGHNPKDRIWENQLLSIDERAAKIHEGMDQCFGVDMDAQFSDGSKPESAQCRLCEKRIRVDLLGAHVLKGHLRAKRLYECVKCGRTSQFCFEMLAQHAGFSHGNPTYAVSHEAEHAVALRALRAACFPDGFGHSLSGSHDRRQQENRPPLAVKRDVVHGKAGAGTPSNRGTDSSSIRQPLRPIGNIKQDAVERAPIGFKPSATSTPLKVERPRIKKEIKTEVAEQVDLPLPTECLYLPENTNILHFYSQYAKLRGWSVKFLELKMLPDTKERFANLCPPETPPQHCYTVSSKDANMIVSYRRTGTEQFQVLGLLLREFIAANEVERLRPFFAEVEKTAVIQDQRASLSCPRCVPGRTLTKGCTVFRGSRICKFNNASVSSARRFRLSEKCTSPMKPMEHRLEMVADTIADRVGAAMKHLSPKAYYAMSESLKDSECTIGGKGGGHGSVYSAITLSFSAVTHPHKDTNNFERGLTTVVSMAEPNRRRYHYAFNLAPKMVEVEGTKSADISVQSHNGSGSGRVLRSSLRATKISPDESRISMPKMVQPTENYSWIAYDMGPGDCLIEPAKNIWHANSPVPSRKSDMDNFALVLYQHRGLNKPRHGLSSSRAQRAGLPFEPTPVATALPSLLPYAPSPVKEILAAIPPRQPTPSPRPAVSKGSRAGAAPTQSTNTSTIITAPLSFDPIRTAAGTPVVSTTRSTATPSLPSSNNPTAQFLPPKPVTGYQRRLMGPPPQPSSTSQKGQSNASKSRKRKAGC